MSTTPTRPQFQKLTLEQSAPSAASTSSMRIRSTTEEQREITAINAAIMAVAKSSAPNADQAIRELVEYRKQLLAARLHY